MFKYVLHLSVIVWLLAGVMRVGAADMSMEKALQQAHIQFSHIFDVSVSNKRMVVATDQGIYESLDRGVTWQAYPSAQLPVRFIKYLLFDEVTGLFASTEKDIYHFQQGFWKQLYRGSSSNLILDLDVAPNGEVFATTQRGIVTMPRPEENHKIQKSEAKSISYAQVVRLLEHEPTIAQVQSWAIAYADVHPNKIRLWREQARKRAWFPSLNIGVDGGRDWSYNDSIYGSSSGTHYIGPDDKSFGEDIGYDVSFSWDLADLIFSSDQTSIDNRSKLMTELREDILDQVTRLYFERRRLQVEIMTQSIAPEMMLPQKIRIAELTALVDGFTNQQFSQNMKEAYSSHVSETKQGEEHES